MKSIHRYREKEAAPRSFAAAAAALACAAAWLLHAPALQAQSVIRIAVLGPMAYVEGQNHWAGSTMAMEEINAAGGVDVGGGRHRIELLRVDTNEMTSARDAAEAARQAIARDGADVLVGGFRSEAVLAMQDVAMDQRKLFLGAGAAHDELGARVGKNHGRYKYWFRVAPNRNSDLGRTIFAALDAVAGEIRAQRGKDVVKVAILSEKAGWTEGLMAAAKKTLPAMKMEIVGAWNPSPAAIDVGAELAAIEQAGADIVFTFLSGPVGIVAGRQMAERRMKAVAFGINAEAQRDGYWNAASGKANFVATLDAFAEVDLTPKTAAWVRAFRARFGRSPTSSAATYDAIMLLRQAIEQAGSTNADDLVPVIEKMTWVGVGAVLEFDRRHEPVYGPGKSIGVAVQWQDGRKVAFWPPQAKGVQPLRIPK